MSHQSQSQYGTLIASSADGELYERSTALKHVAQM